MAPIYTLILDLLYIFGRQQTAAEIMNIGSFSICYCIKILESNINIQEMRKLTLIAVLISWKVVWVPYGMYFQSTYPKCSTLHKYREEIFTPVHKVAEELGDATPALSLTRTRENGLGSKELPSTGAQASREPCVLKALSGATSVTPLKASLQRLATAACS